ncbi:hypothetical protein ANN_19684 [Periplaneta americana]|uniref:Uncharacterized protein n=1 Tax=Periplaneta americana TaxID=6978 RepID=A0ABQ8SB44_PERAM|nr:hypothetical protein ANN_19684 [Periplaneta americana]
MSPGSCSESYPAFALNGLRENPGKPQSGNLSQPGLNPGPSATRSDVLTKKKDLLRTSGKRTKEETSEVLCGVWHCMGKEHGHYDEMKRNELKHLKCGCGEERENKWNTRGTKGRQGKQMECKENKRNRPIRGKRRQKNKENKSKTRRRRGKQGNQEEYKKDKESKGKTRRRGDMENKGKRRQKDKEKARRTRGRQGEQGEGKEDKEKARRRRGRQGGQGEGKKDKEKARRTRLKVNIRRQTECSRRVSSTGSGSEFDTPLSNIKAARAVSRGARAQEESRQTSLLLASRSHASAEVTRLDTMRLGVFEVYVKDAVLVSPLSQHLGEVKNEIIAATAFIKRDMLERVWQEFDCRVDVCYVTRGSYVECL